MRRLAVLGVLGAAVGLYVYDYFGASDTVRGTVASTSTYPHGTHTHTEAVIEYEGGSHRLPQADGLARGQAVWVEVRRGRLSGRVRFVSLRQTVSLGEIDGPGTDTRPGSTAPEPWAYDAIQDRHRDPIHGHWQDGSPPPGRR